MVKLVCLEHTGSEHEHIKSINNRAFRHRCNKNYYNTEIIEVSAFNDAYNSTFGATIIQLNGSTDYVDVAANQNSGGDINLNGGSEGKKNFFTAFKLIG